MATKNQYEAHLKRLRKKREKVLFEQQLIALELRNIDAGIELIENLQHPLSGIKNEQ